MNKMNGYNQPWYHDFGTDFGLDDENGETDEWFSPPLDRPKKVAMMPAKVAIDDSTAMLVPSHSHMPPQLAPRETPDTSAYQATFQGDDTDWRAILEDSSSQAAADAPQSFHNRVRQTALPFTQSGMKDAPPEMYTEALSNNHRADSGIGNFDDLPDFDSPAHDARWIFDQDGYDMPFDDDYYQVDQPEGHDDESHRAGSLQYHLIKTKSRSSVKSIHPDKAKKPEVCPLCPDKQYTGVWAHRNLTRHMESVHAPCSSSDGHKHIVCGFDGCGRTFRRDDARLVHERRSHPELNRPPPAKRRRSGDL